MIAALLVPTDTGSECIIHCVPYLPEDDRLLQLCGPTGAVEGTGTTAATAATAGCLASIPDHPFQQVAWYHDNE